MNSNTKENEMTQQQACAQANKDYPQYRRFTYVRGSEVVVRDSDENVLTTYAFTATPKVVAKQLSFSF